jgi:hypothetical protein
VLVLAGFSFIRAGRDFQQRIDPHKFFAYDCHVFTCRRRRVKSCGFCLKRIGYWPASLLFEEAGIFQQRFESPNFLERIAMLPHVAAGGVKICGFC